MPGIAATQKFKMMRINRRQLVAAAYNPRQIDDNARKKLRSNLKKVGLISPIVWNQRTGNIVSGHQRVSILDSLEKREDYELDVAAVDLDEKTEKEQVVFLNNEMAMGSFDLPKLDTLLRDIDFSNTGFDKLDLQVMLPSWAVAETPEAEAQRDEVGGVVRDIQEHEGGGDLEAAKKKKREVREAGIARRPEDRDVEFFLVLVFRNRDESDAFADLLHVDRSEKYISGEMVAGAVRGGLTSSSE